MSVSSGINDFVVRFANVNGTGSSSANGLFAKSIFRMGVPVSSKNIFPSNIQGLPTWFEVRVSEKAYLGRREGIDLLVAVNPQSYAQDLKSVRPGGFFLYDDSKPFHAESLREDIHFVGVPMMKMSMTHFANPRVQQLLKNMIYLGVLVKMLQMDMEVVKSIVAEEFAKKPKLIPDNYKSLELGYNYAHENFKILPDFWVAKRELTKGKIVMDGNEATGLGLLYGGASVAAWYPITPSTSVASSFEKYAKKFRKDPETGKMNVAIVQAEDELAAAGMVMGAGWNGARAFTATSGAGISLMNEFLGLGYFAEIPSVFVNVQRGGPATGMPTRSQQSDMLSSAYASHGDTKHPMLIPCDPKECFEMAADALDLAERLQTPVFLMTDLDLGMNEHMCEPMQWDDSRTYDRGKIKTAADLEANSDFGRYKDVDGDGIPYRTYPGTHPYLGSYFTRGTSKDEYARYSEDPATYQRNVDRLMVKWETAKDLVPQPEIAENEGSGIGLIYFGITTAAVKEAADLLSQQGIKVNLMRLRGFPFNKEVENFIESNDQLFVIEQNRDAQMRALLVNELEVNPKKLTKVLHYDGVPITATKIISEIKKNLKEEALA